MAARGGSKRLEKELAELRGPSEDSSDAVTASVVDGEVMHWKGHIKGPAGTPYHGGSFEIDIQLPQDYPYNPPKMKVDTKIWHPNISSQTGAICLEVLGKAWGPTLTIRTVLLAIQALLAAPEPSDPQDAEVAEMYTSNRKLFDQTAKKWTETYAGAQQGKSDNTKAPQAAKTSATPMKATAAVKQAPKAATPKQAPKAAKPKQASKAAKPKQAIKAMKPKQAPKAMKAPKVMKAMKAKR